MDLVLATAAAAAVFVIWHGVANAFLRRQRQQLDARLMAPYTPEDYNTL